MSSPAHQRPLTYRYETYGLRVHSCVELPELDTSADAKPDVTIRFGEVSARDNERSDVHSLSVQDGVVSLHVPGVARFNVSSTEIVVDRESAADRDLLRLYLLGACLALVLHLRGFLVLHASAVAVDGRGVILLGHKGSGKSTTAASLVACGHLLIADDIVALFEEDGRINLLPGFPQLKLFDEAVEASVQVSAKDLPRIHATIAKRAYRPSHASIDGSISATHAFVLEGIDQLGVREMTPQQAFVELVRHSYVPSLLAEKVETRAHFAQCVAVASALAFAQLTRPVDLGTLPELADFLTGRVTAER